MMGIVLDLVIVSILVLNIVIGYKKGLMNVIINICAFLIAIVASLILYKPISMIIINNTSIDDAIREEIINNTFKNAEEQIEENKEETSLVEQYITSKIEEQTIEAKKQAIEVVANSISIKAIEILTGIILFIAIRIIIIILKLLTNIINKIPIIEQFNEIGGVIYGFIKAIIIIYILLTILFFVVSIKEDGLIKNAIDNSYITKYLFENNIIINYCLLGKNLL